MPQEFNIPGLKGAIDEVEKLTVSTNKLSTDLLAAAVNAEKVVGAFKNTAGLKDYVELTKKSSEAQKETEAEAKKLEAAQAKLAFAQSDLGKKIAAVNVETIKQNNENKNLAKSTNESATALEKYNAKVLQATKDAKNLGAALAIMEMEGKKNTAEYKNLEKEFNAAATASAKLNQGYRDISKAAGDNRALVGSYSEELKGHFESISGGLESLKANISSGNIGGMFTSARATVVGFGASLQKSKTDAQANNNEMSKTGGIFGSIKDKATDAGKSIVTFFKPSEEHTAQMTQGLERIKIGFTQNDAAVKALKTTQAEANGVSSVTNSTNEKGGIISNLFARGQMALSGATGIASGAFNILKVAIASTGIGLLIIVIALLVDYLISFRPLVNFLKDAFAGLGAVVEMLSDKIGQFVTNIKSFGDLMNKLGDIIRHPIDSIKELGSEMEKTAVQGAKLNEMSRKLTSSEKDYAITAKETENQIRALMLQGRNRTTSEEDRIKIYQKVQALEKGMHEKKMAFAQDEINIYVEKLRNAGKITDDEIALLEKGDNAALQSLKKRKNINADTIDEFRSLMTKRVEVDGEGIAIREKSQTQIDTLADKAEKKQQDEEKKAEEAAKRKLESQKKSAEEAIKVMKITLDNLIANYDQAGKLDQENIAHVQAISLMKIGIANHERDKNLIGVKKGSDDEIAIINQNAQEIVKINQEKAKAIQKISVDHQKFELEFYEQNNKSLLDGTKDLTDQLIDGEKRRLNEILKIELLKKREILAIEKELTDAKLKEMARTAEGYASLTANQREYFQFLKKEESSTTKEIKKNDADLLAAKLRAIDVETKNSDRKYKLLGKGASTNQKNEIKLLDEKLKRERKVYEEEQKNLKVGTKAYDDNAKIIEDIDLKLAENKKLLSDMSLASKKESLNTGLSAVIDIAGKETAVGKAAAIAQATISTYEGAAKEFGKKGWLGYITGALVIAAGLADVAKISGIQTSFATGTTDAPYTGKAIIDEIGAEIHTDKFGNIKSFGSDGGARLTDIVKGDKIIPADISAIIKQTMFSSYGMKSGSPDTIDYGKIGEQFGNHAGKIINAIKNKREASMSVTVHRNVSDEVSFKRKTV